MEDSLTKTLGALHKELRKRKLAPGGLDRSANLRIGGAKGDRSTAGGNRNLEE